MRRLGIGLLVVLLLLCGIAAAEESDEAENLLDNPGFEQLDGSGLPAGWYTDAYIHQEGYTAYSADTEALEGSHSACITNFGMNDARFAQRVEVDPETVYRLSGWIRTENVTDSGRGANLSIEGLYIFSEGVYGTEDWTYVELIGETGDEQETVTVFARLGGYSGESQGKAWFDDLELVELDEVPDELIPALWTYEPAGSDWSDDADEEEDDDASSPFWPWLLVIAAVWSLLMALSARLLTTDEHELRGQERTPVWFWLGLALSFAARIVIALLVEGYPVDVGCFVSWGGTMANSGPMQFYQTVSFCDYTPGYVYVLGLNGSLVNLFGGTAALNETYPLAALIYKLIPCLCDVGMAWMLYVFAQEHGSSKRQAAVWGLLFAFNPAMALNSAAWCQMDSVLCLLLMLVAWLAIRKKWAWVMPVYMLSALVKPQALMIGPLGLLAIVMAWIRRPEERKAMLWGVLWAMLTAVVILLPFCIGQQSVTWLFELYARTLGSYAYATVNTANLYYLAGANWQAIDVPAGRLAPLILCLLCLCWAARNIRKRDTVSHAWVEIAIACAFALCFGVMTAVHVPWTVLGTVAMTGAFAVVIPMYVRGGEEKHLPLLGALLFILLYTLGIKMHERYLFPALIMLGMAFAIYRDRRVLLLMVMATVPMFINSGIVLDNGIRLGSAMGHLNRDTQWLNMLLSVLNLATVPLAVWTADDLIVRKGEPWRKPLLPLRHHETREERPLDPSLHWKRIDTVLVLAITLGYAVLGFWNLGSTKAPQNPWRSTSENEAVVLDLGESKRDFTMAYFCGVSYHDFSVAVSEDGENWSEEYWAQMAQGQCYRWFYLVPSYVSPDGEVSYVGANRLEGLQHLTGRYVRVTAHQIGLILDEIIFHDADGNTLPVTAVARTGENAESMLLSDPGALVDEQDTMEGEPGWYNSTYFDEIYHARTAYEHLHGQAPYETSHPPLGKVLMSVGVAIFGMTPFGWRFMGALAGVLMLPAMYLLGKQLFKRTDLAACAALLMALDTMHFTQTRIATIDSFPVLFILWSFFFMLRFLQKDLTTTPVKKLLPSLGLSGFFMGCAIASKWIGIYAGAGLAVLYFWALARSIRLGGKKQLRKALILCCWCLLFFVAVPVCIYLLSYLPYFAYAHYESFGDYLQLVWKAQQGMFNYHSSPGLGMDHPFYSPWYEWPVDGRPMYYASDSFVPEGWAYAIFCLGNPAVWWVGLLGVAWVVWRWADGHRYTLGESPRGIHLLADTGDVAPAFLLISLGAQFLPWVLVPRGTYIYHYFASTPFLMLSTVLLLRDVIRHSEKAGRAILWSYVGVCALTFLLFFPYASGFLTPIWWLDIGKRILSVWY